MCRKLVLNMGRGDSLEYRHLFSLSVSLAHCCSTLHELSVFSAGETKEPVYSAKKTDRVTLTDGLQIQGALGKLQHLQENMAEST